MIIEWLSIIMTVSIAVSVILMVIIFTKTHQIIISKILKKVIESRKESKTQKLSFYISLLDICRKFPTIIYIFLIFAIISSLLIVFIRTFFTSAYVTFDTFFAAYGGFIALILALFFHLNNRIDKLYDKLS